MSTACDELRSHLDDLLDGLVRDPRRSIFEAHLESCAACRNELESVRALRLRAASLPAAVAPSRDLWPGIEARLGRRASYTRTLALAASLVAALGAAGIVALWTRPSVAPPASSAESSAEALTRAAELARIEDGTLASRRELARALERRRDELPPELATAIETNMDILQTAMGEIRHAIEVSPRRHRLDHLLANRYQQEAEILRRLERL